MHRRTPSLLLTSAVLASLSLTGCPEEGKEMMKEAREAHDEAINDMGGAPKRQVDHAETRLNAAAQKSADRYDSIPEE